MSQNETGDLGTVMQESLAGMRVVKAFAREEFEINKFDSKNMELRELNMSAMRLSAWNQPLMVFVAQRYYCAGTVGWRYCSHQPSDQPGNAGGRYTIYVAAWQPPVRTFGFMVNWFDAWPLRWHAYL